ncbi:4-hydroxythreonine-4-phosphate dehydrogenase PdxA [Amorphus sp. 3PC139-8]|uniref:4-hydroxythreonine-4-phosphate dehydrogenase PdxA n=1 Tax=Amorphus sp. 3PC139-8 TaxID=2735676 RepID=UPI00345D6A46
MSVRTPRTNLSPLAITLGEPAGIGPDLILEAWRQRAEADLPPFFVVGDPHFLARRAAQLALDVTIESCRVDEAPDVFAAALPVVETGHAVQGAPGSPDSTDAPAIIASIDEAVSAVHDGAARAVVTSPIHKKTLYAAGFAHPGHTEYLGELADSLFGGSATPIMMLAGPSLRTVPVTVHIPLKDVPSHLTTEKIVTTGQIVAADLTTRFGIDTPRLAITGLNPHAGEGGSLGTEDETIVAPAVVALREKGVDARGPLPADALFSERARAGYDAALAMYHDQALIPVKTIAFDETVNVTLGLPFVRTSPDHGTAFDLAASGKARPESFLAAIAMADRLSAPAAALSSARD